MSKKTSRKAERRAAKALARSNDQVVVRPPAKDMTDEVAKPSMTGIRRAWSPESMVDGLTPDKLSAILRQADNGDLDGLLVLANEMEERDPHYASVLNTRKLAVKGLEKQLVWSEGDGDHPRAEEIHKACKNIIDDPAFKKLMSSALDALAKPYSVTEIEWETTASAWTPIGYLDRDPRWYQYDRETGRELRMREDGAQDGVELQPARFMVLTADNKSGLPARRGLMRLVAFSFVCKLYGIKDWMAYAEIFGIPLRLGKYDAGASPEDVEVLKRAVFGLGSDAAAVIPESMKVEFPNLGAAGGAELFMTLVNWIDSQVSKAVLGQTGTTDMQKGGGFAQATVLNEVRIDLLKADAEWLSAEITQAILEPFVFFNFGPDAPCPSLVLVVDEPEDVAALTSALGVLVPLGLEVDQDEVRKKLRLSKPAAGAQLLKAPAPVAAPPVDPAAPVDLQGQAHDQRTAARARVDAIIAEARARRDQAEAQLDEVQLAAMDGWERTWGGEVADVVALAQSATSFDDLVVGLNQLAENLAAPAASRSLANAMFQAAVIGRAQTRQA